MPVSRALRSTGSDWLAGPELESGRLTTVLSDYPVTAPEGIYVIHSSARLIPAEICAFLNWIVYEISHAPWRQREQAATEHQ
ncbi:hypothetical protein [Mesorhizobium sp.]|uniref:hypothetical protein n=1 Tax=Mesorhizobium sp. TaxID=1871066 RepID=UPI0012264695|nr:hypothetical protein [Mesorhizobium sp.]TIP12524.1 MAG: hypothetical protein E5X73_12585 [Mesorhizobium sp.]